MSDPRVRVVQEVLDAGGDAQQVVDTLQRAGLLLSRSESRTPIRLELSTVFSAEQAEKVLQDLARRVHWLHMRDMRAQVLYRGTVRELVNPVQINPEGLRTIPHKNNTRPDQKG